jgi:hypothetical protein
MHRKIVLAMFGGESVSHGEYRKGDRGEMPALTVRMPVDRLKQPEKEWEGCE